MEVINLTPLFAARRIAAELLRRSGIDYFTLSEKEGPAFRLDPAKIDLVVDIAGRAAYREQPWLETRDRDVEHCRRMLRRDLIRELAVGMVLSGY
ncbi:MAG: hypothetical protein JXR96_02540 [Deltaproteobacteria bacterium]|nr:hypothetical protein [Deltaproteobacteria bacterium]